MNFYLLLKIFDDIKYLILSYYDSDEENDSSEFSFD